MPGNGSLGRVFDHVGIAVSDLAASNAFFHGFSAACLVAAGVSAAGAIVSLLLLPAHPAAGLTLALETE